MINLLQILIYVLLLYLLCGILFSLWFYFKGMGKIDKATVGSTWGFKLIVFPGVVVFWPALLSKWFKKN